MSAGPRRLGYATDCLTCEARILPDELAFRESGVGAWHADCDTPRNLKVYQRERDRDARRRQKGAQRFRDSDDD